MEQNSRGDAILVPFAEDYRSAAVREITVAFPGASVEQLGPDLAAVTLNGSSLDDLAHAIRDTPLVFARHLSAEAERIPLAEARIDRLSAMARALADEQLAPGGPVAVQCWVSGEAATAFGSQNLYHAIAAELEAHGRQAQRSGTGSVLSASSTARESHSDSPPGNRHCPTGPVAGSGSPARKTRCPGRSSS